MNNFIMVIGYIAVALLVIWLCYRVVQSIKRWIRKIQNHLENVELFEKEVLRSEEVGAVGDTATIVNAKKLSAEDYAWRDCIRWLKSISQGLLAGALVAVICCAVFFYRSDSKATANVPEVKPIAQEEAKVKTIHESGGGTDKPEAKVTIADESKKPSASQRTHTARRQSIPRQRGLSAERIKTAVEAGIRKGLASQTANINTVNSTNVSKTVNQTQQIAPVQIVPSASHEKRVISTNTAEGFKAAAAAAAARANNGKQQ